MSRSKEELEKQLRYVRADLEALKIKHRDLGIHAREGWTRADLFEAALKSKQNYQIPSNSKWYREQFI